MNRIQFTGLFSPGRGVHSMMLCFLLRFSGFPRDQSLHVSIKPCGLHCDVFFFFFLDLDEVCVSVATYTRFFLAQTWWLLPLLLKLTILSFLFCLFCTKQGKKDITVCAPDDWNLPVLGAIKASCFITQIEKRKTTYILIPLSVTIASLHDSSAVNGQTMLLLLRLFVLHCTVCEYPL